MTAPMAALVGGSVSLLYVPSATQLWEPLFDLGEKDWMDFDSSQLPDGLVSSWIDRIGGVVATQATTSFQPTMSAAANGVLFSGGKKQLVIPNQSSVTRTNRGFVLIFKADITNAPTSSGTLCYINGASGSGDNRAPYVGYNKGSPNTLQVNWANGATSSAIALPAGSDSTFHVLIGRLDNGVSKVSLDGGTEVTDGTNVMVPRNVTNQTGLLGDFHTTTSIALTINRLMIVQEGITDDEVLRIAGWGLWHVGAQANLSGGHPYAAAPPTTKPYINPYPMTSSAEYDAVQPAYWTNHLKDNYASALGVRKSLLTRVYFEDCLDLNCIADETVAPGGTATLFGPVQDASGGAQNNLSPSDTNAASVFSQSGSELTITMSKPATQWISGNLCTVNFAGRGFSIDPRVGPIFVEGKIRFSNGNGVGIWGAPIWLEPTFRLFNLTTPYNELDVCECYNSDTLGRNDHCTLHYHPGARLVPGRLAAGKQNGKDFFLDAGHLWPNAPTSVFDGNLHLFQTYLDRDFWIFGLDDYELGRCPSQPFMMTPMHIITTLNLLTIEAASAAGSYTMGIDYIAAYQGVYS